MATSEDVTGLCENKEEQFEFENCCTPCNDSGDFKISKVYCGECKAHLCDQCLRDHNKFQALRAHKTVDNSDVRSQSESGSTAADEPTERCALHLGQVLVRFCKDHGELCCAVCVALRHRKCTKVDQIKDVAKGITNSKEFKEVEDTLKHAITKILEEQQKRKENISSLEKERTKTMLEIENSKDDLIRRINEIARQSKEDVNAKHTGLVKAVESDINNLETVLSITKEMSNKVHAGGLNDTEMFTRVIHATSVVKDVNRTVGELSNNWHPQTINYFMSEEIADAALSWQSFGYFLEESISYHVSKERNINVKMINDKQKCEISGICTLEDGTYLLSDFNSRKLKRLSTLYEIIDSVVVNAKPTSVCTTGKMEVAVALRYDKKVQFVSCGEKLSPGASFTTELRCTGLYFESQCVELYVLCGAAWMGDKISKVNVYKKDGTLMRSYEKDENGSTLFSSPNNIVIASYNGENVLVVSDRTNGLIALTKDGKKLWVYNDKKLKQPWGLCLLPGNQLLATGFDSENILQIGVDGKEVRELVDTKEGLHSPYSLLFNRKKSTLMIGCADDEIRVYKVRVYKVSRN